MCSWRCSSKDSFSLPHMHGQNEQYAKCQVELVDIEHRRLAMLGSFRIDCLLVIATTTLENSSAVSRICDFDKIEVSCVSSSEVRVTVHEKWTWVPTLDLAHGTVLADTYVFLGLTRYNFLGLGSSLEVNA